MTQNHWKVTAVVGPAKVGQISTAKLELRAIKKVIDKSLEQTLSKYTELLESNFKVSGTVVPLFSLPLVKLY